MTDRDYQHSRPLDVHRWSEHREINNLVNLVFEKFIILKAKENKTIRKKHLRLVLLDLYVAWLNDPDSGASLTTNHSLMVAGFVVDGGSV